jgi:hypothetical protein
VLNYDFQIPFFPPKKALGASKYNYGENVWGECVMVMVFNATFNNISVISQQPVL